MKKFKLDQTGWNDQLLVHLAVNGCSGMEVHCSRVSDLDPCTGALESVEDLLFNLGLIDEWILVGDDVWQPDNRLTRYNGILKSFGVDKKKYSNQMAGEWLVEEDGKIKFFGVFRRNVVGVDTIFSAWKRTRNLWIIFGDKNLSVDYFSCQLSAGWRSPGSLPQSDFLGFLRENNLIAVRELERTPSNCIYLVLGSARKMIF